jgi:DNA-binding MarR family transcriptional regulator
MYDARNVDALAAALIDLTGCLNSPRQDEVLLHAAGVSLDRALFPLLVRLSVGRGMSVAQLAEQAGRDPSTVSRQLARLEQLGLIRRPATRQDLRVRAAIITRGGMRTLAAITDARRRLLTELLREWSPDDRELFPRLVQRLADSMRRQQAGHSAGRDALPSGS